MLHRKFRLLLTINYYLILAYGLMPAPLHMVKGQLHIGGASFGYLIYSLCVTVLSLWGILYSTPTRISNDHSATNIVIKWIVLVLVTLRIIATATCYGVVWLLRRRLTQLYQEFILHWNTSWTFLRRLAGAEALQQLQLELAVLLRRHIYLNMGVLCCFTVVQYHLGQTDLGVQLIGIALFILAAATRIVFVTMLLLLVHQFKAVQLALQNRCILMGSSRSGKSLRRIADIHSECKNLARRAFSIYDLVNTVIFLNMFAFNICFLYHAVQYTNHKIQSDLFVFVIGRGLLFFNIWSTLFVLNLVDYTVNSCNSTGQLLRPFSNIRHLNADIQMELELFSIRLRHNYLVYRACGCLVIDKPACLSYMASVACNVLILMQFDLQNEANMKTTHTMSNLSSFK